MADWQDNLEDYVTGRMVANVGAEENRQRTERLLVDTKGYGREEIGVDVPIEVELPDGRYRSCLDLVVTVGGRVVFVVKCAAGSLGSRQREALAAARLADRRPAPLAVVSDGLTATVLDTASGKPCGQGFEAIPDRRRALELLRGDPRPSLTPERRRREALIFRSYDSMNVNVARPR